MPRMIAPDQLLNTKSQTQLIDQLFFLLTAFVQQIQIGGVLDIRITIIFILRICVTLFRFYHAASHAILR